LRRLFLDTEGVAIIVEGHDAIALRFPGIGGE
jgi:hypothetical protein